MIGWLIKTVLISLGVIIIGHRRYLMLLSRFTTSKTETYVLCDNVVGERKQFEGTLPPQEPPHTVINQVLQPESSNVSVPNVPTMQAELTSFLLDEKLNNLTPQTS